MIAVGSGERSGRGDDATQTELLFLPERHTDFIFAVIGERFGFLGAAFVIFLYWCSSGGSSGDADLHELLRGMIAGGVLAMLAFQVIVNVGHEPRADAGHRNHPAPDQLRGLVGAGTFLALGLLQSIHAQSRRP